jgi:hypothetical protein
MEPDGIRIGTEEEVGEARTRIKNEYFKKPEGVMLNSRMLEILLNNWPVCCGKDQNFRFRDIQLPMDVLLNDHHFLGNPIEAECEKCGKRKDISCLFVDLL